MEYKNNLDTRFGSVSKDFIFNYICGTTYHGIKIPTVSEISEEFDKLVQAAHNNLIHQAACVKHTKIKKLRRLEEELPTKVSTPKLDIVLSVLGFDVNEGYSLNVVDDPLILKRTPDLWVRNPEQPDLVFQTNVVSGKLRMNYLYMDMWKKTEMKLYSKPYGVVVHKNVIDLGDYIDEDSLEEDI